MYKRLYNFSINNHNIINISYKQVISYITYTVWILTTMTTSHALINITENIQKARDDGNIDCGVFVGL